MTNRKFRPSTIFVVLAPLILFLVIAAPLWHEHTQGDALFQQRREALENLLRVERPQEPWIKATLAYRDLEERQLASQELRSRITLYSTIVMTLVTIVLVWATWRYVELTSNLVKNSERQLTHIIEREQAARIGKIRSLQILCQQLLTSLEVFPADAVHYGQTLPPWNDQNVAMLKISLYELWSFLGIPADAGVKVVDNLQWVAEARRLQSTPGDRSTARQEYDMYYGPKLQAKLSEIRQGLQSLVASCQSYGNSKKSPSEAL